jgi:hypothetical protein
MIGTDGVSWGEERRYRAHVIYNMNGSPATVVKARVAQFALSLSCCFLFFLFLFFALLLFDQAPIYMKVKRRRNSSL